LEKHVVEIFKTLIGPKKKFFDYFYSMLLEHKHKSSNNSYDRLLKALYKPCSQCEICNKAFAKNRHFDHQKMCKAESVLYNFPIYNGEIFCPIGVDCPSYTIV
jgi:hypothetical protein